MGRQRTLSRIAAPALGVVLAFSMVSAASAGQRGDTHVDHATSHADLAAETGRLNGIAATRGGAWAVGDSGNGSDSKALTLYWNGTRWQPEPSPSPPDAVLDSVAATSPTNVWAVGSSGTYPAPSRTLILHRSGKKWQQMPSIAGSLSAVAATSPTNAWAVGATDQGDALILHWNGKEWQQMPSPAGTLSGVAATSPTNAWAVGSTKSFNTLILHWNGKTWQQIPSANPGIEQHVNNFLSGVAVLKEETAWAVGNGTDCGCGPGTSLIERWNGKTWGQVPTPTFGGGIDVSAVAPLSSSRGWAVGQSGSGDGPTNGVILEWNGSAWVHEPVPGLEAEVGSLSGVAATSRSNAWAVGWESPVSISSAEASAGPGDYGTPEILILHWNGSAWTPQTALGPSQTPVAAVATTTTTTLAPTTTTTTSPPSITTTSSSTPAAGGPLLGSAAWVGALGFAGEGVQGFGEVAPAAINAAGGNAPGSYVNSISWSNWGAPQAMGQGQSTYVSNPNAPLSDATQDTVTVVAFDLGSCNGGPPAYEEVEWYSPGQGQTFDSSSATNACTGQ